VAKPRPRGKAAERPATTRTGAQARSRPGRWLVLLAHGLLYLAIGIGFLAWEGFPFPNTWAMVLLLPLPWAALALPAARPDLFSISWTDREDGHETLALLMFGPALALPYYAFDEFTLTQWGPALRLCLLYGLIGSAAITGLAVLCCRRLRAHGAEMVVLALGMGFYAGAAALTADVWLDRAEPEVYRLPIISARAETHSHSTGPWYFTLGAWGPRGAQEEYAVEHALYQGAKAGQIVCIVNHPGRLGMAWHEVEACHGRGTAPGAP